MITLLNAFLMAFSSWPPAAKALAFFCYWTLDALLFALAIFGNWRRS